MTGKRNLLDANPIIGDIDMQSEMKAAIKTAVRICPEKLVMDCSIVKKCQTYKTYAQWDHAVLPFVLEEIENACGITYQPAICTDKLCIAIKSIKNNEKIFQQ